MSVCWKPPVYEPRGRERQWLNSIWSSHDCFCGCDTPATHLQLLLTKENIGLSLEPGWLATTTTTTETDTAGTDEGTTNHMPEENQDDITEDILQKLFEENGDDTDDLR